MVVFDNHLLSSSGGGEWSRCRRFSCVKAISPVVYAARNLRAPREPFSARTFGPCASRCGRPRSEEPRLYTAGADLPVALARPYGTGRTFWSNFVHAATVDDLVSKYVLEPISGPGAHHPARVPASHIAAQADSDNSAEPRWLVAGSRGGPRTIKMTSTLRAPAAKSRHSRFSRRLRAFDGQS